jgi:hypothetical protein
MANRFVTFLEDVGKDLKNGLAKIAPFATEVLGLAAAATPEITALDPALGAVFATTVATVSSIEQKFTALGNATGSGPDKLAQAMTILEPVITQAFQAAGKASDVTTVQNYISAVVNFLNAIPANGTAPAPAVKSA